MIENIVFDLGGVIITLDRQACVDSFKKLGFKDFDDILNDFVQDGFFLEFEKGAIDAARFREIICDHIGHIVKDYEIDNAMGDFLSDIPVKRFETLLRLKKSYNVFLLSNTNPIAMSKVRDIFSAYGIDMNDCFDKMYLSYQMKMVKPNNEIFLKMMEDSRIKAEESLFIDDGEMNINTANSLGFKTLHLKKGIDLDSEIEKFLNEQK
ncbi:MAG TPA: HAD family phosphatase [Rikenellaceae bacterium]|nr:HAD family phosphatase [Rikenellaceae bacterium]